MKCPSANFIAPKEPCMKSALPDLIPGTRALKGRFIKSVTADFIKS